MARRGFRLRTDSASGLAARSDPRDPPVERGEIDLAGRVLAERRDRALRVQVPLVEVARAVLRDAYRPQPAVAIVGKQVKPLERRNPAAAVHEAADDRAAAIVSVLVHGLGERRDRGRARAVRMRAFPDVPAEVPAAVTVGNRVDLLPLVLPDVGDHDPSRDAVETETPRIAKAERPGFRPESRSSD